MEYRISVIVNVDDKYDLDIIWDAIEDATNGHYDIIDEERLDGEDPDEEDDDYEEERSVRRQWDTDDDEDDDED